MSFSDPALILPGAVTNTEVSASAAIAYSKLNLATSIVDGDISTSAAIGLSKLASITQSQPVRTLGTVYQNTSGKSLFVSVTVTAAGATAGELDFYTDAANPPTTIVCSSYIGVVGTKENVFGIVIPNNYYKVTMSGSGSAGQVWTEWT